MKFNGILLFSPLLVIFFISVPISYSLETNSSSLFKTSHYEVQIRPILGPSNETGEKYTVPGSVRIFGETTSNLSTIWLHANQLNITTMILMTVDKHPTLLNVTSLSNITDAGQVEIQLEEEVAAGVNVQIYMEYEGKIKLFNNEPVGGLILFEGKNETKTAAMIPPGTLFPDSHKWHPLFPFLDGKATFNVTVIREENFTSVSNTELLTSIPDPNYKGWMIDQFSRTRRMKPELISVAVLPNTYSIVESTYKNKTMRIHAQQTLLNKGEPSYAVNMGSKLLHFYSTLFNETDGKIDKMDFVILPGPFHHRNWGKVMGSENYTGEIAFIQDTAWHATILLKLVDLEWFTWSTEYSFFNSLSVSNIGNLVAGHVVQKFMGRSVNMMDLYPGIVQYLKYLGLEYLYTESEFPSSRKAFMDTEVMLSTVSGNRLDLLNLKNFSDLSFEIKRWKGFEVLKMMEAVLTKDVMLKAIKSYWEELSSTEYFISQEDFYEILQRSNDNETEPLNLNISGIMQSWINQKGYPVVKAEVVNNGTQIRISQERFNSTRNEKGGKWESGVWGIPLFVVSEDEPEFQRVIWLRNESMLVEHNSSLWIILNNGVTGLYRVLYDEHLYQGILEQLKMNASVVNPLSRARLMTDYIKFSEKKSNYTSVETLQKLTGYLGQETEYIVWKTLAQSWWDLEELFVSRPEYQPVQAYFHQRYDSVLEKIGVIKNASLEAEPPLQNDIRSHLLRACTNGVPSPLCSAYGKQLATEWKADVNNSILISEQGAQYFHLSCAAVASGGGEVFKVLYSKYEALGNTNETCNECVRILSLFGCLQDPSLVKELVGKIISEDSALRKHKEDAMVLLARLIMGLPTVEARVPVWNLLRTDIDSVRKIQTGVKGVAALRLRSGFKYSKAELEELVSIFTDNGDLFDGAARRLLPELNETLNEMDTVVGEADRILNFINLA